VTVKQKQEPRIKRKDKKKK